MIETLLRESHVGKLDESLKDPNWLMVFFPPETEETVVPPCYWDVAV